LGGTNLSNEVYIMVRPSSEEDSGTLCMIRFKYLLAFSFSYVATTSYMALFDAEGGLIHCIKIFFVGCRTSWFEDGSLVTPFLVLILFATMKQW